MITLLWTRSSAPVSRLIRWMTGEDCSHFAIEIDGRYVFHSNLMGGHLKWRSTFLRHAEVVYQIPLHRLTPAQEEAIYRELIHRFDEQPWDWGAGLYLWYRLALYRLVGTPLPTRNLWASSRAYLCVELAVCLEPAGIRLPELDTILPGKLYSMVRDQYYALPKSGT